MRAEWLKVRSLPTPRWTLAVCGFLLVLALAVGYFAGVGEEDDGVLGIGLELPTAIGSIVLGAWIVGLEYGQGTMRRTLTADPRRTRLFGAKLAVIVLVVTALTLGLFLVGGVAFHAVAAHDGLDVPWDNIVAQAFGALEGNLVGAVVGAAVTLLTRSMAGGVTVALAFAFILDTALSAIPSVGDWTLSTATIDIYETIRGDDDGDTELARAVLMTIVWCGGLSVLGLLRFERSDV